MIPVPRFEIEIDADCGFCQRSAGWLKSVDFGRAIAIKPVHEPGMIEMRIRRLRDGKMLGGFDGFRMLAPGMFVFWPLVPLLWLPGAGPIGRRVYRWVARNRHRMPGSTAACELPPAPKKTTSS